MNAFNKLPDPQLHVHSNLLGAANLRAVALLE